MVATTSGGVDVGDDLRRMADDLEAQLAAGRPARHDARARTVGRLVVSGRITELHVSRIEEARKAAAQDPDPQTARSNLQVLDLELLRIQGYTFKDGTFTGPSSPPGGDPGAAPEQHDAASPGAAGGGGGGGTITRSEARRRVQMVRNMIRDDEEWRAAVRVFDVWTQCQEQRALLLGPVVLPYVLERPKLLGFVRREVADGGDAAEVELWSEDDIHADYTAAELGEGGPS